MDCSEAAPGWSSKRTSALRVLFCPAKSDKTSGLAGARMAALPAEVHIVEHTGAAVGAAGILGPKQDLFVWPTQAVSSVPCYPLACGSIGWFAGGETE